MYEVNELPFLDQVQVASSDRKTVHPVSHEDCNDHASNRTEKHATINLFSPASLTMPPEHQASPQEAALSQDAQRGLVRPQKR
jgi:hypothetical protein